MCKRTLVAMFLGLVVLAGLCAPVAAGAEPARPKQLDLTYIAHDVYAVIVFHPQQMARSPEVAALLKNEQVAAAFKRTSFDPLKTEEIVGQILVPSKEPRQYGTALGDRMAVRFSPTVDIDAMAKVMLGGPRESLKIVTATVAGKKCYKFEEVAKEPANAEKTGEPVQRRPSFPPVIACVADDRTVLVCVRGEADLKKMLAGGEVKSPLVERLRRTDVSDDIVAVFALEPMRESIKEDVERLKRRPSTSPELHIDEIALLLKSATFKVDLSDDARSSAVLEADDAGGAAKVEALLNTFRQVAKDDLDRERKRLADRPEEFRKAEEPMMSLAEEALDAMTWTTNGSQVTVTLKGTKGLVGRWFATSLKYFFTSIPARPNSPEDKQVTEPASSTPPPPPRKSRPIEEK